MFCTLSPLPRLLFSRLLLAGCIALTLLLFGSPVRADDRTVRKEIEAMYKHFQTCMEKKDVDRIAPLLASDFVYTAPFGSTTDKAGWLRQWRGATDGLKKLKVELQVQEITVQGNSEATALYQLRLTGDAMGLMVPGRPSKVEVRYITRDLWIRSADGWKQKRSADLREETLLDGFTHRPEEKPEDGAVRQRIQEGYDQLALLYQAGNYTALDASLTAGYFVKGLDRITRKKAVFLARQKETLQNRSELKVVLTVDRLRVEGDTVVVLRAMNVSDKVPDDNKGAGKTKRRVEITYTRETFTKTAKGWVVVSSEELLYTTK